MKQSRESSGRSVDEGRRGVSRLVNALRIGGFSVVLATAATGCVATLGTDAEYAEADDAPADMTVYPHTVYEGRDVYLVNDRYYYRGPQDHWVYYRNAPAPLVERRSTFVRQRPYVQQAPVVQRRAVAPRDQERHLAPEVRAPEPATQVR